MSLCKAKGCRFNKSHVTSGHLCGSCQQFGHGEQECGNNTLMNSLKKKSVNDKMSETTRCSFIECTDSSSHSNSAHYCKKCNERGHCEDLCPKKSKKRKFSQSKDFENLSECSIKTRWEIDSEIEKEMLKSLPNRSIKTRWEIDGEIEKNSSSISSSSSSSNSSSSSSSNSNSSSNSRSGSISSSISSLTTLPDYEYAKNKANKKFVRYIFKKMYTCIPVGMGCMYFFKISDDILESLFMHSDDWCHYKKFTEQENFIAGYTEIK
jgi:hypothetical protein